MGWRPGPRATAGTTPSDPPTEHVPEAEPAPPPTWGRRLLVLGVLVALAVVFAVGVSRSWRANADLALGDQGANLDYVVDLQVAPDHLAGDRNRMPLYPALVAAVASPDASRDQLHDLARWVNVALSVLGCAVLGRWAARRIRPLGVVGVVGAAVTSVFVFRAALVQPETLFFLLFAVAAATMARTIRRPVPVTAAAAGLASGLAYLTKASAAPLVLAFALVLAWDLVRHPGRRRPVAAAAASFALLFLATTGPYLLSSWRSYGSPTYNVNTAEYAWTDSWDEARQLPVFRGADTGPAADRPSPSAYLDRRGVGTVAGRFGAGLLDLGRAALTDNLFGPLIVLQVLLLAPILVVRRHAVRAAAVAHGRLVGFALLTGAGYAATLAWWAPISMGPRFHGTLAIPCIAGLALLTERAGSRLRAGAWRVDAASLAFAGLLVGVAAAAVADLSLTSRWIGGS